MRAHHTGAWFAGSSGVCYPLGVQKRAWGTSVRQSASFALLVGVLSCQCQRGGGTGATTAPAPPLTEGENARGQAKSKHCFSAAGDARPPAQTVFDELGRSGNGETWRTLLEHAVAQRARVGPPIDDPGMGFGMHYAVEFQNRKSWIGYDAEAGGAVFCTGDAALFDAIHALYLEARQKPDVLRALIKAVPEDEFDD